MLQFDCHAHVFETSAAIPNARYVPTAPAHLADWQSNLAQQGLAGGVLVQVSFLGTDNAQLCAALAQLDRARFVGVAVVDLDVSDAELDRLVAAGIRGVRWNLVKGAEIPDPTWPKTQAFVEKLRARALHLELHLEGPRLAAVLPGLANLGLPLVIDHFGLPSDPRPDSDPMIRAVRGLRDRADLYFKFSAHYRTGFDLRPHAETLLECLPDGHVVWGSDWPHTQHEGSGISADVQQWATQWADLTDRHAARSIYGLCAPDEDRA